jgi:polyisoprenoid-binding protein YceI
METSRFRTATFELTQSITLGSIPAAGSQTDATATGKLTLHGTTKVVTFKVQAQRAAGSIKVAGSIPITFADYSIENPSGGPAQVGDTGELEFLLVFEK